VTEQAIVLRKLAALREHTARLERRRPVSPEALAADVELQDALSMSLLVSVQAALDVALHITSARGLGVPASYSEGVSKLAETGLIDAATCRRLMGMAALRNRVAHGYASIDFARIWAELPDGIAALHALQAAVLRDLGG
jgi:uncharacterized protein YutE (UPF0331/DUF86 family)